MTPKCDWFCCKPSFSSIGCIWLFYTPYKLSLSCFSSHSLPLTLTTPPPIHHSKRYIVSNSFFGSDSSGVLHFLTWHSFKTLLLESGSYVFHDLQLLNTSPSPSELYKLPHKPPDIPTSSSWSPPSSSFPPVSPLSPVYYFPKFTTLPETRV